MTQLFTGQENEGCEKCNECLQECKCPLETVPISKEEREKIKKELSEWLSL